LLGTFTFRIETWILPVGIAIFFLFFLPKIVENRHTKKSAAIAGVLSFLSGIVINQSVDAYYEKDLTVKSSADNAYEMNFSKDYERIKSAIDPEGDLSINNLELSFKKDGTVDQFSYSVYYYKNGINMNAWVDKRVGEYQVSPYISHDETNDMGFQSYIASPSFYFQALDLHGIKKMVQEGDQYYVSFSNTEEIVPDQKNVSFWNIQKSGIEEHVIETVSDEEAQTDFLYQIAISSMKHSGAGSYVENHHDYFMISPDLYQ
jgi:hypothetical protein